MRVDACLRLSRINTVWGRTRLQIETAHSAVDSPTLGSAEVASSWLTSSVTRKLGQVNYSPKGGVGSILATASLKSVGYTIGDEVIPC